MQYFSVLLKVIKTLGTQSVPSRLTQLKKITLACYECLCLYKGRSYIVNFAQAAYVGYERK